ncbi:MAG: heavy-metal-associated domain-containing protein [Ignavibacteriaceae bacterium]
MNNIIELKIKGMTCDSCATNVSKVLASVNGVDIVKINGWKSGHATINLKEKTDSKALINAVKKAGYGAEIDKEFIVEENKNSFPGNADYDLIIIGGGSAAFAAAIKASELEKKILMINEGLPIGGTCVNVGCVPSKTLIRTAEAFHNTNHTNFKSIKTGNSKVDFKTAIRQKTELVEFLRQKKYVDILKDDPNVKIIEGRGKLTDKNSVTVDGHTYTSQYILIATGSSTFIPDIHGLDKVPYLTNDTLCYRKKREYKKLRIRRARH